MAKYLLLFGLWQMVITLHWAPDYLFPSPYQVFRRGFQLIQEGLMTPSVKATLIRMGIGFSIAAVIGLVTGMLMGMNIAAESRIRWCPWREKASPARFEHLCTEIRVCLTAPALRRAARP